MNNFFAFALLLTAVFTLSGCVVPYYRDYEEYGLQPQQVHLGKTTRSDISKKALPEVRTPEDRFQLFSNTGSKTWGLVIIVGGPYGASAGGAPELGRTNWGQWILLEFDDRGVVKNAVLEDCADACEKPRVLLTKLLRQEYGPALASKYERMLEQSDLFREAIESNDLTTVSTMLEQGFGVDFSGDEYTPLLAATLEGAAEIVEVLLEYRPKLDVRTPVGMTPLHISARDGNLEIVQLLLDSGAAMQSQDFKGRTPLHLAARGGRLTVIKELISRGADVNAKDDLGDTPLALARTIPSMSAEVIELLERQSTSEP